MVSYNRLCAPWMIEMNVSKIQLYQLTLTVCLFNRKEVCNHTAKCVSFFKIKMFFKKKNKNKKCIFIYNNIQQAGCLNDLMNLLLHI